MQPRFAFCKRCRGMRVGWNKRYISHWLFCKHWLRRSSTLGGALVVGALVLGFPEPGVSVSSTPRPELTPVPRIRAAVTVTTVAPELNSIKALLERHEVNETNRSRLAEAIVASSKKYGLNAKLLASIMIVESRGNPFAISNKNAIGIMQIHLPTWGQTADREGINLLKIEDNIDFGARILKNYVSHFGLWEGVKRYNGFIADNPVSEQSADDYVVKVQRIYGYQEPLAVQAALF